MNKLLLLILFLAVSTLSFGQTGTNLNRAKGFAVLAADQVNNTGRTVVTGDLGISPGAVINDPSNGLVVTGSEELGNAAAANAQDDALALYNTLKGRTSTAISPTLTGPRALGPGVYKVNGDALVKGILPLDGQGNVDAAFVFIVTGNLNSEANAGVLTINGAQPQNIFWVVGKDAKLANSAVFQGNVIAQNDIYLSNGAGLTGRAISLGKSVFFDNNNVLLPNLIETDLVVQKTANGTSFQEGDLVTYTVTARNAGPNSTTDVIVKESVPAGLQFVSASAGKGSYDPAENVWTVGSLAIGQSASLSLTFKITRQGTITNTVTISGYNIETNPADNQDEAVINVTAPSANLSVQKSALGGTFELGGNVSYTLTARNAGPGDATGVVVQELVPEGLELIAPIPNNYDPATNLWTVGDLANGASATLTPTFKITKVGVIINGVRIAGDNPEVDPEDNEDEEPIEVILPRADLSVTKTADVAQVALGDNVTYTIKVSNAGPNSADNVIVQELVPAGLQLISATASTGTYNQTSNLWTVGTLANGGSATLTLEFKTTQKGQLVNGVQVVGDITDTDPGDNTDNEPVEVKDPRANLSVTKTASATEVPLGDEVTYTITASNAGPGVAEAVKVQEIIPAGLVFVSATASTGAYNQITGLWTVGTLENGGSATLTLTFRTVLKGVVLNAVQVVGDVTETDPGDNKDEEPVEVTDPRANLSVTKTASATEISLGDNVTYTITASNQGPGEAKNVTVQERVPVGLVFVSATASAGNYNAVNGLWTVGTLANGGKATLTLVFKTTQKGQIVNGVSVVGDVTDSNPDDDDDEAPVDVVCPVLVPAAILGKPVACVGEEVTYSVAALEGALGYIWTTTGDVVIEGNATGTEVKVKVNGNGTVAVAVVNRCGTGDAMLLDIEGTAVPATPAAIEGPADVCAGSEGNVYTVAEVPGATAYNWTLPEGWVITAGENTNHIIVRATDAGGSISVSVTNACFTGEAFTMGVNIAPPPVATAPIVDNSTVCEGLAYAVDAVPGAASYTWSVPAGFTIVSGQGTTSIKVKVDNHTASGNVTVVANNAATCSSPETSLPINLNIINGDLSFPKAFSPNNDGKNETWVITNLEKFTNNEIVVFNVWGSEVFKAKNYQNDWNGGSLQKGTYFYKARVTVCYGVEKEFTGYVTIFR